MPAFVNLAKLFIKPMFAWLILISFCQVLNNENVNYDDNKDYGNFNDFDNYEYDYDYVYHEDDDKLEIEDLRRQGISPLPKPPPGIGLLPTPPQPPNFSGPPMGPPNDQPQCPSSPGRKIPSIFDIVVQPTDVFAHKMGLRYVDFMSTVDLKVSDWIHELHHSMQAEFKID